MGNAFGENNDPREYNTLTLACLRNIKMWVQLVI